MISTSKVKFEYTKQDNSTSKRQGFALSFPSDKLVLLELGEDFDTMDEYLLESAEEELKYIKHSFLTEIYAFCDNYGLQYKTFKEKGIKDLNVVQ